MASSNNELYQRLLSEGKTNPLVAKAIAQIRLRQKSIKKAQDELLESNKKHYEDIDDKSGAGLEKAVRQSMAKDEKHIKEFTSSLKNYKCTEDIPFSVRTNKMDLIFEGTRGLFGDDETNIVKLAEGKLPTGYDNNTEFLPVLNSGCFWGSSAVSFLSNAILATNFTLANTNIMSLDLSSAITHVAPLPKGLKLDSGCRYSYLSKDRGNYGFGFVHSGYAFGGFRYEESLYPKGKTLGPEDCSSWVAKLTGCPYLFSTVDQMCTQRLLTKKGYVPEAWKSKSLCKDTVERFKSVEIEDIMPGDIHILRVFDKQKSIDESIGRGGHTTLVLGKKDKDTLLTLGFNRNMPNIEGFGLQEYPVHTKETKDRYRVTMYQRLSSS